jgi:hypothetical protein
MKSFLPYLLTALLFLSCNNKKEDNPPDKKNPPDSINRVKTDRPSVNPYASVDISPMDMSYYPIDYPKLRMTKAISTPPLARVVYSRPHLQGRHIFHEVLKYEEPWRLGANEATELELFSDATIQDKKIKAGRYVIYCIPHKDSWTVVLNSNIDSWGLEPDVTKDVARFTVPVTKTKNSLEFFTIVFEKKDPAAELVMAWDDVEVRLPISF